MQPYYLGLYEKAMPEGMAWQEKLRCARECGYDFIEISIDESPQRLSRLEWTVEQRRALVRAMEETGLPVRSMCLSGHRRYPMGASDPAIRRKSMEIMSRALDLADDLGIRTIQLAGYDVYYEPGTEQTRSFFEENLHRAAEMAAARGILLGFETMETAFMDTVEKSMYYVQTVNSPYLGIYPDAGNLTNAAVLYDSNISADMRAGAGHLLALHLKPTKPGIFRNIQFDDVQQHVNFPEMVAAAWFLGVRRYVTELWSQGSPDWKAHIKTANRVAREALDKQARGSSNES